MKVEKRINEIVNRLNKTKTERKPDLKAEKDARDREDREVAKKEIKEKRKKEEEEIKRRKQAADKGVMASEIRIVDEESESGTI